MSLIIGLGNPGARYTNNRHNIGFVILDRYIESQGASFETKTIFQAMVATTSSMIFAKPLTFMNDSGVAVSLLAKQYAMPFVVVHDDIDIPLGVVKCSFDRGAGGHNGVESIINHFGHKEFLRIRVGVRPVHEALLSRIAPPHGFETFLLSDFAPFETELLEQGILRASEIIKALETKSFEEVMNTFN